MEHYEIDVFWHDPSNCWVAVAPDFPGSSAVGDTRLEAFTEMQRNLAGWIEAYREDGRPIPAPTVHREYA
jgi:predicted RNase H-like HicB family nuclease